jgi:FlaA1/EpsC-like NDP-sugar epimerase
MTFFTEKYPKNLYGNTKRLAEAILSKKNRAGGGITLPDFKIYHQRYRNPNSVVLA